MIDFAGGIGVVNAGHCPPPVVKAIQEQAAKFLHVSFNVASYEPYIALCEKLNALLPHGGPTKTMLVSTGAEAVENAIKIAKQATGRQGVLCFTDAFHGRTMMAMTLTSKVGYKIGCGPFAPRSIVCSTESCAATPRVAAKKSLPKPSWPAWKEPYRTPWM